MKPLPLILIAIAVGAICYWFGVVTTSYNLKKQSSGYVLIEQRPMPWHHICEDTTHYTCWQECICEGEECFVGTRNYQIHTWDDSVAVYRGDLYVGQVQSKLPGQIDSLLKILKLQP